MIQELSRPLNEAERRLICRRSQSVRSRLDAGFYSSHIADSMNGFQARLNDELRGGLAYIIHCVPTRIITREQTEDEGDFWIFDGGDGRYLSLFGQDFYQTPRFPSSDFEMVFGATHRTGIGIRSLARTHPPLSLIFPESVAWDPVWQTNVWRDDWRLFTAPPNISPPELLKIFAMLPPK